MKKKQYILPHIAQYEMVLKTGVCSGLGGGSKDPKPGDPVFDHAPLRRIPSLRKI